MNNYIFYKRVFKIFSFTVVFLTVYLIPFFGWSIILLPKSAAILTSSAIQSNGKEKKSKCSIIYLKNGDSLLVSSFHNRKGMLEYVPCQNPPDSTEVASYSNLLAVRNSKGKIVFTNDPDRFPGARTNFYLMGLTSGVLALTSFLFLFIPAPFGVILAGTALLSAFVLGIIAKGKMKKYQQKKGFTWAGVSNFFVTLLLIAGLLVLMVAGIEFEL